MLRGQKQSHGCRRCIKCITITLGMLLALFLVLSASVLSPGLSSSYPFHAQCSLQWSWEETNCTTVHSALLKQIQKWENADNCKSGGEKCLYKLIADDAKHMSLEHTTPVRHYVDSVSFGFCDASKETCGLELARDKIKLAKRSVETMQKTTGCVVSGFSKSQVWYAVLDYGTNYCNMRNLADGAGLVDRKDFIQTTNDDICTQFSSADCDVY